MIFLLSNYSSEIIFYSLVVLAIIVFIRKVYVDYRDKKYMEELTEKTRLEITKKKGDIYKRDGLFKIYHYNGKLSREGNKDHGNNEGLWKYYYENGQLKMEGTYKKYDPVGVWKMYHNNGELEQEGNWKKGKKEDGLWKHFHENGQIQKEGNIKEGK